MGVEALADGKVDHVCPFYPLADTNTDSAMTPATAVRSLAIEINADTEDCVKREETRMSFQRDGVEAWRNHQAAGLHVTAMEANEWLTGLQAGQATEPHECHV